MGPDQLVFFWLILSSLALCALLFGNRYLNNRETMAMIEKGMDPRINRAKPRSAPFRSLKVGLLMVGAGLGLLAAYFLDNYAFPRNNWHDENSPLYFALIAVGGGIGLILSYRIEKKDFPEND